MKELRLRLIKERKIVGYLRTEPYDIDDPKAGLHWRMKTNKYPTWGTHECHYDSFDMGIKVGDNTCVECQARPGLCHEHKAVWWFAGDKGKDMFGEEFMLAYEPERARWCIDYRDGDTYSLEIMLQRLHLSEHIGTVYDKEEK